MVRLAFVLLFALALWPPPAAASGVARGGEPAVVDVLDHQLADHVLHAPGGFGLRGGVRSPCPSGGTSSEHRPPARDTVAGECDRNLTGASLLAGPSAATIDAAVPPHCELLPYFATPPPFGA